jgi:hypothetical protein
MRRASTVNVRNKAGNSNLLFYSPQKGCLGYQNLSVLHSVRILKCIIHSCNAGSFTGSGAEIENLGCETRLPTLPPPFPLVPRPLRGSKTWRHLRRWIRATGYHAPLHLSLLVRSATAMFRTSRISMALLMKTGIVRNATAAESWQ